MRSGIGLVPARAATIVNLRRFRPEPDTPPVAGPVPRDWTSRFLANRTRWPMRCPGERAHHAGMDCALGAPEGADHIDRRDSGFSPATEGSKSCCRRATARQLARVLGRIDVDQLTCSRQELRAAVAELATAAGKQWRVEPGEPVVVLLRALSRLALEAPDATSTAATELLKRHARIR